MGPAGSLGASGKGRKASKRAGGAMIGNGALVKGDKKDGIGKAVYKNEAF